ncbi:hypothetical protein BFP71_02845 [Roseivirga misakiensis]|uniref:Uncharacterized protein n=1 Tax=Roseivirga misakiensis TaxID=1563681 RepID=A0A1E5T5H2_9BACT|nr:hypothetical protein BFP71_02845 [Roseivirga misakiensis]
MIAQKSNNSKYISLTIGIVVALLSIWQVTGRRIEMRSRLKTIASRAVLVPVLYGSSMTALSIQINQYLNQ